MKEDLEELLRRVRAASGKDEQLDRDIMKLFGEPDNPAPYTGSVDSCIHLIEKAAPGWHWHVGYGPKGVMPYATLSKGEDHYEALAPTVPLALLTALLEAQLAGPSPKG